jgi:hypothetical protein
MIIESPNIRHPDSSDYQGALKLANALKDLNIPFDLKISQVAAKESINPAAQKHISMSSIVFKKRCGVSAEELRQARITVTSVSKKLLGDRCKILGYPHRFQIQVYP